MLTATRTVAQETLFSTPPRGRAAATTNSPASTSFGQQLAQTLQSYLDQVPSGSHLQIEITPQQGQNSGERQFLVTVKENTDAAPAGSNRASTATGVTDSAAGSTRVSEAATAPVLTATYTSSDPAVISASSLVNTLPQTPPSSAPPNETDAYWAQQPSEVQTLRTIPDLQQRIAKGWELAQKGYTIDPDIMLYQTDPYMTMVNRASRGYTWYPGLGQPQVLQPGVVFPGMTTYQPSNPPAGSIAVNTDFAKGLEQTSIWYTGSNNTAAS